MLRPLWPLHFSPVALFLELAGQKEEATQAKAQLARTCCDMRRTLTCALLPDTSPSEGTPTRLGQHSEGRSAGAGS